MTSLFSKIRSAFSGGGQSSAQPAAKAEPQEHAGCLIYAEPVREGSQLRLAGRIVKQVEGQELVRNFVRADMFTSMEDALDCTFRKGRQIIDQNGASLFADGVESRSA
ncbi:HlyU family transcriptional regulator [Rhizobium sp. SSA_523]|uniref:HlyU family transcriptional regulator n=1 Tax=Rhizobium sp. SSA_523 TaxID=2952477 RepID=UPI002090B138|nr:HlyU family transcriptional regulator [Rhizobium sp. SSA_523]MCO5734007.1 HlyU family transcriptional regulator [Rhizobium sp. SSA_523]WKC24651.1 HlyU family transcriptional regulator [Rhizobium sp. SSA_523]